MRSFTPEISWHNRDPVLSLDISERVEVADGERFYRLATSGTDSHVILWKLKLAEGRKQPVQVRVLADLTRHEKAVNVVRFAPIAGGNFLASADDDGSIIVWKLEQNEEGHGLKDIELQERQMAKKANRSLEGQLEAEKKGDNNMIDSDVVNLEFWSIFKILRGHLEDVTDIAWSPDGQQLVSGSVDNESIVWDVNKGLKMNMLSGHKGYVQGVAWDPCNQFLTTLCSDRNLRVYNAQTRKIQFRVQKISVKGEEKDAKASRLFYDYTLQSFCRRLCFSPGGEFLLAPSGVFETGSTGGEGDDANDIKFTNTCYLFLRNSINKPFAYYSSDKFTVAARCCPTLFKLRENVENRFPFPYRVVFAVATQNSILVYDTQQSVPFALVSNIHYTRLTDITWSTDGRLLMVSSVDGFCTFVNFKDEELGIPYEGPKYQFEPPPIPVPIVQKPEEPKPEEVITPEALKFKKKVSDIIKTPSIVSFFNKVPKDKSISKSTSEKSTPTGVKRKEIVDLTLENEEINSTPKRVKEADSSRDMKQAASPSIITIPAKKLGPHSIRELSKDFERVLTDETNKSSSSCVVEAKDATSSNATSLEVSKPATTDVPIVSTPSPIIPKQPTKAARRVAFTTLTAPKRD